jgi:hypothetical protein
MRKMTQKDNILQELKELRSSLENTSLQNIYNVPAGYFEALAEQVLQRIRALEAENGLEELYPILDTISAKTPFTVPAGYFDGLADRVLNRIRTLEAENVPGERDALPSLLTGISKKMPNAVPAGYFDGLAATMIESVKKGSPTSKEELETLSPLLSGLKKQMPYSVPEGYFEGLDKTVIIQTVEPQAKVISITKTKWFRYAAAAVVTGVVAVSGFLILSKQNNIDPKSESAEWVKKNLKKVSTDDIEKFADLADEGALAVVTDLKNDIKEANEVKELIKDIPQEEIQKFLDETQTTMPEENSDDLSDDIFMN